jgi:thioredoxin 1
MVNAVASFCCNYIIIKIKSNNMALQFTDSNFESDVLKSDKVTMVDFWAEWCGPCKAIGPLVEQLSKEYEGKANIGKMDVDANSNVPMQYGIRSIPTILFFKGGQLVDKTVGAVPKATLEATLKKYL